MVSLPIPASKSPTAFGDIQYLNEPIGPMVESLTKGAFDSGSSTHLDPDLDPDALLRAPGWLPAFGQTGSAQTHLANNGVGPGDLFLFFGWFREAEETPIGWRYVASAPDLHIIFGWLQVGEVLRIGAHTARYASQYPWLAGHPHLHGERSANNTVYVATNSLALPGVDLLGNLTGGGVFGRYAASRRLTAPGQGKRTVWRLPAFFYARHNRSTSILPCRYRPMAAS